RAFMFDNKTLALVVTAVGLLGGPVSAVEQRDIKAAIERDTSHVRSLQDRTGAWPSPQQGMVNGATALVGLTLLECGVKVTDRQVAAAADFVRNGAPQITNTYSLALSIAFLDRLGDPADAPLIQSLSVRLLAGQTAEGGWPVDC